MCQHQKSSLPYIQISSGWILCCLCLELLLLLVSQLSICIGDVLTANSELGHIQWKGLVQIGSGIPEKYWGSDPHLSFFCWQSVTSILALLSGNLSLDWLVPQYIQDIMCSSHGTSYTCIADFHSENITSNVKHFNLVLRTLSEFLRICTIFRYF